MQKAHQSGRLLSYLELLGKMAADHWLGLKGRMTLIGVNGEDPACPRRQAPSKGKNGLLGFG